MADELGIDASGLGKEIAAKRSALAAELASRSAASDTGAGGSSSTAPMSYTDALVASGGANGVDQMVTYNYKAVPQPGMVESLLFTQMYAGEGPTVTVGEKPLFNNYLEAIAAGGGAQIYDQEQVTVSSSSDNFLESICGSIISFASSANKAHDYANNLINSGIDTLSELLPQDKYYGSCGVGFAGNWNLNNGLGIIPKNKMGGYGAIEFTYHQEWSAQNHPVMNTFKDASIPGKMMMMAGIAASGIPASFFAAIPSDVAWAPSAEVAIGGAHDIHDSNFSFGPYISGKLGLPGEYNSLEKYYEGTRRRGYALQLDPLTINTNETMKIWGIDWSLNAPKKQSNKGSQAGIYETYNFAPSYNWTLSKTNYLKAKEKMYSYVKMITEK